MDNSGIAPMCDLGVGAWTKEADTRGEGNLWQGLCSKSRVGGTVVAIPSRIPVKTSMSDSIAFGSWV